MLVEGGSAIFGVPSLETSTLNHINTLSIEKSVEISGVLLTKYNIYLVTFYRPPTGNFQLFMETVESVISDIGSNKRIILLGDFNVHFGTNEPDCILLCDILISRGFRQLVTEGIRQDACIDNIFINFSPNFISVTTLDSNLSDHSSQILQLTVDYKKERVIEGRKVCRPVTEAGLFTFHGFVSEISWDFINQVCIGVDEKFDIFIDELCEAYLWSFPEKTYRDRSDQANNLSWFNDSLRNMRETLRFLSDRTRMSGLVQDQIELENFKNKYKQALKAAKIGSNDRLISTAKNPVKRMWQIIDQFRGKTPNKNIDTNSRI